ncbi:MAG: hypothetical protein ACHQ0J_07285 [Candidatus Dormibacterales bacterium]
MAGYDLPVRAIRSQVASAINVIVHLERFRDGSRKVVLISEIVGMEEDVVSMQDVFRFIPTGLDSEGRVTGSFVPTSVRPRILERFAERSIEMPPEIAALYPDVVA